MCIRDSTETTPALDPPEKVELQLAQEETDYWLIALEGKIVGAVRVVKKKDAHVISPLFIIPEEPVSYTHLDVYKRQILF